MIDEMRPTEPTEVDRPHTRSHLTGFDWLHALAAGIIVVIAVIYPLATQQPAGVFSQMAAVAVALAAFSFFWHRFLPESRRTPQGMLVEDVAQVVAVSFLVGLSGGPESPLVFLYYAPLVLGGLTTGLAAGLTVGVVGSLGWLAAALMNVNQPLTSPLWWGNALAINIAALTAGLMGREILKAQAAIADAKDQAERFSSVDWLTGLYNRRHLEAILPQEIARARRHDRPVSLLIADADHLKEVNDTLGHILGDQLLVHIAEVILEQVRLVDTVIRYGGDEFIIILPDTDPIGALIPGERIRQAMDGYAVEANGVSVKASISIGVAAFPTDADDAMGLLARADAALYVSKRNGRNQITIYHPDLPTDRTPIPRALEAVE